jgi:transposase
MAMRHLVTLTENDVTLLSELTRKGIRPVRQVLYARALLLMDTGPRGIKPWDMGQTAHAVGLTTRALKNLKQRFINHGLDAALERKKPCHPSQESLFDEQSTARLAQLASSKPPDGHDRWTMRLLAEQLVELKIVPSVSAMTVCKTLNKMGLHLAKAHRK